MQVLAPASYRVTQHESFQISIQCQGTAYLALGDVNGFELSFTPAAPSAQVTPSILSGPGSINHVFLHVVYQGATPTASYTIQVIDANGVVVDQMGSSVDPTVAQPYRDDFDLRVNVV
jgi:hypothetical protein